jgi:DNA-binding Xre family transcriptional regulator
MASSKNCETISEKELKQKEKKKRVTLGCLSSMCEVLSSNPSTIRREKKRRKERKEGAT